MTAAGGEVVILDFLAGHSTTRLIEKIQKILFEPLEIWNFNARDAK